MSLELLGHFELAGAFSFHSGLLEFEDVVVFLAFLGQDVLAVDEIRAVDGPVRAVAFVLVDGQPASLNHLAAFALGGEYVGGYRQQVDDILGKCVLAEAVLGHAVEYREEGPFVERAESLPCTMTVISRASSFWSSRR